MSIRLRTYRPADFEALYALDQTCYPPEIAYSRAELRWYLHLPGADCLVAESAARLAGFLVSVCRNLHAHIITLDVVASFRRCGIGTSLLRRAESLFVRRGAREVWLETATDNPAAIAFWQKRGYRIRGRLEGYYPGGLDAWAMIKNLAAPAATKES